MCLGEKLCESLFDFARCQHAVERIEWLTSGKLGPEHKLELAKIVLQDTTREFVAIATAKSSGIAGLVERLRGRTRGRSASPPAKFKPDIVAEEEIPRTMRTVSEIVVRSASSLIETASAIRRRQERGDGRMLEELYAGYGRREAAESGLQDTGSDSEFEGGIVGGMEEAMREPTAIEKSTLRLRGHMTQVRAKRLERQRSAAKSEPRRRAVKTPGEELLKNQRSLKDLLKLLAKRRRTATRLRQTLYSTDRPQSQKETADRLQMAQTQRSAFGIRAAKRPSPRLARTGVVLFQEPPGSGARPNRPGSLFFASVAKQVACIFKRKAMIHKSIMSESMREQEEHMRKTLRMRGREDSQKGLSKSRSAKFYGSCMRSGTSDK